MKRASIFLLAVALCCTVCSAYIATPLVGYQQGITLQLRLPAVVGGQCSVYGVPTPTGYAPAGPTPLFVYTPQGTGSHVLQFVYDQNAYALSPLLAPGQTTLQIDASDQKNPLISFNSTSSPQGQPGAVTVYLSDVNTGSPICFSQIQFEVSAPLSCLPNFGGIYGGNGGGANGVPSGAGQFVIPGGQVYAPTFVQQTVIQQFTTINNININQVTINVNQVTNTQIINNVINVLPPTPAPVNCTVTPQDPACQALPPSAIPPAVPPQARPPTSNPATPPLTGAPPPSSNPTVPPSPPTQPPTANPPVSVLPASTATPPSGAPQSAQSTQSGRRLRA